MLLPTTNIQNANSDLVAIIDCPAVVCPLMSEFTRGTKPTINWISRASFTVSLLAGFVSK